MIGIVVCVDILKFENFDDIFFVFGLIRWICDKKDKEKEFREWEKEKEKEKVKEVGDFK